MKLELTWKEFRELSDLVKLADILYQSPLAMHGFDLHPFEHHSGASLLVTSNAVSISLDSFMGIWDQGKKIL